VIADPVSPRCLQRAAEGFQLHYEREVPVELRSDHSNDHSEVRRANCCC
jgi:hypothetical protein